eukprot:UN20629
MGKIQRLVVTLTMNIQKKLEMSHVSIVYSTPTSFCAVGPSVFVQWGRH